MIPQVCVELVKKWEGLHLSPYLCPANIPTIGYGATRYEHNGQNVTLNDAEITKDEAERMLARSLERVSGAVSAIVGVDLNDNQLSALTSLAYNIGLGAFRDSTLVKLIKQDPASAKIRYEFSRWNKSRGVALPGLITRRKDEANLYFKPVS